MKSEFAAPVLVGLDMLPVDCIVGLPPPMVLVFVGFVPMPVPVCLRVGLLMVVLRDIMVPVPMLAAEPVMLMLVIVELAVAALVKGQSCFLNLDYWKTYAEALTDAGLAPWIVSGPK